MSAGKAARKQYFVKCHPKTPQFSAFTAVLKQAPAESAARNLAGKAPNAMLLAVLHGQLSMMFTRMGKQFRTMGIAHAVGTGLSQMKHLD